MNLPSDEVMALVVILATLRVITDTGVFTTVQAERKITSSFAGDPTALDAVVRTD